MRAEARLADLGLSLPDAPTAVAAYVPTVVHDGLIFVSGQVPLRDGALPHLGLVGREVSEEEGVEEARWCAINCLAQLRAAAGSLDAIERILKVTVFVASADGYGGQPVVANGASELLVEVFGDAGRHARAAVGCSMLPLNVPVEVELIAALSG